MQKNPKLLDLVRNRLRLLHKSIHTERQYIAWMTKYIAFCNRHEPDKARWRHPKEFGGHDVEAFLTHFAVEKHVAASTQNQALCALVFLYREILGPPFDRVNAVYANRPALIPVVFSRDEAIAVIESMPTIWRGATAASISPLFLPKRTHRPRKICSGIGSFPPAISPLTPAPASNSVTTSIQETTLPKEKERKTGRNSVKPNYLTHSPQGCERLAWR